MINVSFKQREGREKERKKDKKKKKKKKRTYSKRFRAGDSFVCCVKPRSHMRLF